MYRMDLNFLQRRINYKISRRRELYNGNKFITMAIIGKNL